MDVKEDGVLWPVADKLGVPTDMLIFFGGEAFCLLCAILYYKFLPPSKVGATLRHVVAMTIGVSVGYFSFGMQFNHVVTHSVICYVAMKILPQSIMHIVVFSIALTYLVSLHLYRAYMIPEDVLYSIDVSGPLMIVTEKITSLVCSIYDGRQGNKDKLSDLQKRYMISKPPSVLEYFSYLFYFQGVVVGPLSFYRDYVAYVQGTDISKKPEKNGVQNNNDYAGSNKLSPFYAVSYKMSIALFWMGFHFTMKPIYPEILNSDLDFIRNNNFMYRFWYMIISMLCCRAKYYVAFSLGDAICNASGFGFNGYDSKGQPKWDLVTNVNVLGIEGASSPKLYIENWNIQTAIWLRLVCYDRIPVMKKLATFLLSAMWHGCYPGYYFTFIFANFVSESARLARRKIRPYFQGSRNLQLFYDVLTWICTHIVISYLVVPFTILHYRQTLAFYTYSMYGCLHIVVFASFFILPYIPTVQPGSKISTAKPDGTKCSNNLGECHQLRTKYSNNIVECSQLPGGASHKSTKSNGIKKE